MLFLLLMVPAGNMKWGLAGSRVLDPDSYERLLRVERLVRGSGWYDISTPWAQPSTGSELHWTRPFDVAVAVSALPFRTAFPPRQALVLGGALVPLILGCLTVVAVAWAARLFVGSRALIIVAFTIVAQQTLARAFRFSYIDHHALLLLCLAVAWAGMVRGLASESRWPLLAAGAAAGLGLWVSVEALVWIAVLGCGVAVLWVLEARDREVEILSSFYRTAAVVALAALLVERPPIGWIADEMDRISLAHVVLLAATGLAWNSAHRFILPHTQTAWHRAAASVLLFGLSAALAVVAYPKLLQGPLADVDPRLIPLLAQGNAEANPFKPHDRVYMSAFYGAISSLLIAGVYCATQLRKATWGDRSRLAVLSLVFLAAFTPLMFFQWRWVVVAQLACALPWLLAIRAPVQAALERGRRKVAFAVACSAVLAVAPIAVALATFPHEVLRPRKPAVSRTASAAGSPVQRASGRGQRAGQVTLGQCTYRGLAPVLAALSGKKGRRIVVLAPFYDGPQLAWEAGVRVLSGPYHRNGAGLVDSFEALTATEDGVARSISSRRGVDFVVICTSNAATRALLKAAPKGLTARLLQREQPDWLVPVSAKARLDPRLRVWEVMPDSKPGE